MCASSPGWWPTTRAKADGVTANTGRSKSFYIREALHEHLDELEERYLADRVIRDWESSDKKTRLASELWTELGA